jgi:hypothetical protein
MEIQNRVTVVTRFVQNEDFLRKMRKTPCTDKNYLLNFMAKWKTACRCNPNPRKELCNTYIQLTRNAIVSWHQKPTASLHMLVAWDISTSCTDDFLELSV